MSEKEREMQIAILNFIHNNHIKSYNYLINYCINNNKIEWYNCILKNRYHFIQIFRSINAKLKDLKYKKI